MERDIGGGVVTGAGVATTIGLKRVMKLHRWSMVSATELAIELATERQGPEGTSWCLRVFPGDHLSFPWGFPLDKPAAALVGSVEVQAVEVVDEVFCSISPGPEWRPLQNQYSPSWAGGRRKVSME